MKDFHQLFINELREMYHAEGLSAKMMPKVIHAAKSPQLKKALEAHLEETKRQVNRLEQIASELNESLLGAHCEAMHGLWKEWELLLKPHYSNEVQDCAIIGFMQKIKHYEIAVYGTLKTYSRHMNKGRFVELLRESMHEESCIDKRMTEIAEGSSGVNAKACKKRCA